MGNCLVTKLKGSVQGDLPKLGVMKMGNSNSTSQEVRVISHLKFSKDVTLKATGGQFVTPYNQSSLIGYTNNIPANTERTIDTQMSEVVTIDIPEKYSLLSIKTGASHVWYVEDVQYSNGLTSIYGNGDSVLGDYTVLAKLPALESFILSYSSMPIDALMFANSNTFTALQTLNLTGCTNVANKSEETKALIEAAHPGITVTW